MSALGDREEEIQETLDRWHLDGNPRHEAYKALVELHQLRDQVYLLKHDPQLWAKFNQENR